MSVGGSPSEDRQGSGCRRWTFGNGDARPTTKMRLGMSMCADVRRGIALAGTFSSRRTSTARAARSRCSSDRGVDRSGECGLRQQPPGQNVVRLVTEFGVRSPYAPRIWARFCPAVSTLALQLLLTVAGRFLPASPYVVTYISATLTSEQTNERHQPCSNETWVAKV